MCACVCVCVIHNICTALCRSVTNAMNWDRGSIKCVALCRSETNAVNCTDKHSISDGNCAFANRYIFSTLSFAICDCR